MRNTTQQQRWFLMAGALGVCSVVVTALLFASDLLSTPLNRVSYLILALIIAGVGAAAYLLTSIALKPIGDTTSAVQDEVSQRRTAQLAETASRELLREIIDLLPCVVFARRHDNELIFANQAVAQLYGTTLDDLLQGSFAGLYQGVQPDGLLFSSASGGEQAEVWFSSPNGETHRFLVSRVPYLDATATLVVGVDVTKEHNLQMQLQFSQRLEVIGTLAGGIAHDFNNLLTPILGYSSLLMDTDLRSEDKDKLASIHTAAKRARDVVQQILTFSRAQETIPGNVPIAVDEVVSEAAALMRASIPSNIQIDTDFAPTSAAVIDPSQLHQVIVNLCTNAAQAIHSGDGLITIRIYELRAGDNRLAAHLNSGSYVCIEVKDNGIGMSREVMNHIFEPFFTTKGVGEGSGLGLSVVHGIVTSHQGEITLESEEHKGSTLRILLPSAAQAAAQPSTRASRIMLVDDEASVLKVTEELLEAQGFRVQSFIHPDQALSALAANPQDWDVLITDHNMPEMTGADLARATRKIRPEIPIILITGFANPEAEEFEGIDHKIMKPVTGRELSLVIKQSLAARHHAA